MLGQDGNQNLSGGGQFELILVSSVVSPALPATILGEVNMQSPWNPLPENRCVQGSFVEEPPDAKVQT